MALFKEYIRELVEKIWLWESGFVLVWKGEQQRKKGHMLSL